MIILQRTRALQETHVTLNSRRVHRVRIFSTRTMRREPHIFLDVDVLEVRGLRDYDRDATVATRGCRAKKRRGEERFALMHFAWGERFCQYRCCDRKLLLEDTIWIRGHRGPRCRVELESGPTVTNKLLTLRALPGRSATLSSRRTFAPALRYGDLSTTPALSHKSMIHTPARSPRRTLAGETLLRESFKSLDALYSRTNYA